MRPKEFQEKALETFSNFRRDLKKFEAKTKKRVSALEAGEAEVKDDDRDHFANAWEEWARRGLLPQVRGEDGALYPPQYARRKDSRGRIVPHVCLKLPTGGGKTLLGVAAVERMRPRAGLVLWIMPSRAIHKQTLNAFAHRMHPYRQWLERACGGRVKLLRKRDGFSLSDVESYLCVMPVMLQAADRQGGSFLKIFRDTGKYPGFFPEPDDKKANDEMLRDHPDLHTTNDDGAAGAVKHSLFNALKIARPIIVLDEAHNAYTENRRRRLCEFNPRFVLELSATPALGVSNILVDVPGADLKREEMIKLPLNIHNFENADWKYTLSKSKERLDRLEQEARKLQGESGRYIRPMMLIRVERVGKEQRDGQHIHADDVRDYLMTQLKVPAAHIRRKTAEKDEIADEDLLSPYSTVRYILTKDALREGWDCPFAYILTLLDSTNTARALTQMTGRVLRQPDTELTGRAALDESYIYCFDRDVGDAITQVKRGLEQEGMSDLAEFVQSGGDRPAGGVVHTIRRRKAFRDMQIFLPHVLHRMAGKSKRYRRLNYEKDVLGGVDWNAIAGAPLDINTAEVDEMREIASRVDLPGFDFDDGATQSTLETDEQLAVEFFTRRVYEILPNPWLAGHIVARMFAFLRRRYDDRGIFERRYHLSEILKQRLMLLVDHGAGEIFRHKLESGDIRVELVADDSGFELPQEFEILLGEGQQAKIFDHYGEPPEKSLYQPLYAKEFNGLEKEFALYLDGHSAVTWWHRFAARQDYGLQGWRRHRVYPDFVVCVGKRRGDACRVLVLETKGMQLAGNPDTDYKEKLLHALEDAKPHAVEYGSLRRRGKKQHPMSLRMLFEDNYKERFGMLVGEAEA